MSRRRMSEAAEGVARDDGDIIVGWLTRVVVGILATALVGFDMLSIGIAHVSTANDAKDAARAASQAWYGGGHSESAVISAAQAVAGQHGEHLVTNSVRVDADGTVHLTIQHDATTVLLRHLGSLRRWATVNASGSARYRPT